MVFTGDVPRELGKTEERGRSQERDQVHEKSDRGYIHPDPGGMLMSLSHPWELSQPEDRGLGLHSPNLQSLAEDALGGHKFPGPPFFSYDWVE